MNTQAQTGGLTAAAIATKPKQIAVNKLLKRKEIFAQGLSFYKLFGIFVFGCLFGTYWEQLLELVVNQRWVTQQGVIYGPFNPVYGFGAAGLIWLLCRKERKWYRSFVCGGVTLGSFEYLLHELEYVFTGTVSWDYTDTLLALPSIATRGATSGTSIPHMLFWGGLGLFLMYVLYPPMSKLIEATPAKFGRLAANLLVVFLVLDMALTGAVLLRHGERAKGNEPKTVIGQWIDDKYSEEYVYLIFPDKSPGTEGEAEPCGAQNLKAPPPFDINCCKKSLTLS